MSVAIILYICNTRYVYSIHYVLNNMCIDKILSILNWLLRMKLHPSNLAVIMHNIGLGNEIELC